MKKKTNLIIAISVILIAGIVVPKALAQKQIDIPSEVTLFKNVKVFNGTENRLLNVDVLVVKNKIHKVARNIPSTGTWEIDVAGGVKEISVPSMSGTDGYTFMVLSEKEQETKKQVEVNVIDGGGKTLMPGLIDSHVHFNLIAGGDIPALDATHWEKIGAYAAYAAKEHLSMGFTTVRDLGGMHCGMKEVIDAGLLEGPRVYAAGGFISQTGGHGDFRDNSQYDASENNLMRLGISRLADGRDEVLKAVRDNYALGSHFTKIMISGGITSKRDPLHATQYTNDELSAAIEVAKSYGSYATAHVFHDRDISRGLDLGLMCIDHGHFITEETCRKLKDKGAFISMNVAAMSDLIIQHPVYGNPANPSYKKVMSAREQSKNLFNVIRKVKPKVVFNSDFVFLKDVMLRKSVDYEKWFLADELGNFWALKALTSIGGELCALTGEMNPYPDGKLGVIEEGAYADILIVDGNPLEDIRVIGADPGYFNAKPRGQDVKSIKLIMKDGKIYKNTLGSGTQLSLSSPDILPSQAELAKADRIFKTRFIEAGGWGCCAHAGMHTH